jgi:hypothetical protein
MVLSGAVKLELVQVPTLMPPIVNSLLPLSSEPLTFAKENQSYAYQRFSLYQLARLTG